MSRKFKTSLLQRDETCRDFRRCRRRRRQRRSQRRQRRRRQQHVVVDVRSNSITSALPTYLHVHRYTLLPISVTGWPVGLFNFGHL